MTTVINLSLFNLNLDKPALSDFRFNKQSHDKNQHEYLERNLVIDVTHESKVILDDEDIKKSRPESLQNHNRLKDTPINSTYDRLGRMVRPFYEKGIYLNAYA